MPQELIRAGKFSIDEVVKFITGSLAAAKDAYPKFAGHPVHIYSKRYQVFTKKGTKCVTCGLKATHFCLEKHRSHKTKRYHFNLYGINASGGEVLFTKDHILPRFRGGSDRIENLQTMCSPCNEKKGSIVETKTD